jgi:hypothetical protein
MDPAKFSRKQEIQIPEFAGLPKKTRITPLNPSKAPVIIVASIILKAFIIHIPQPILFEDSKDLSEHS